MDAVYITGGMVPFNLCGGRGVTSTGSHPHYAVTVISHLLALDKNCNSEQCTLTWVKHSNYQPPLMGSSGLWLRPAAWCIWGPVGFECSISYECPSLLHIQSRHLFLSLFPSLSPCHLLKSSHRAWGPPLSACLKFKLHFCAMPDLP